MLRLAEHMKADPKLIIAAHIANTFRIDPVIVLTETDPGRWAARYAAAMVIQDAKAKAVEEAKARRKTRGKG